MAVIRPARNSFSNYFIFEKMSLRKKKVTKVSTNSMSTIG